MKNTGKAAIFILCLLTGFFLWGETVRAGEEGDSEQDFSYIDSWLASCDMGSINEGMDRLFPGFKLDGTELLKMVMEGRSGEAFRQLLAQIGDSLTGELGGIRQILIYILVLGVVSALFAEFSDLFAGEQIAQAGFYFLYLFLMVILTKVFLFVSRVPRFFGCQIYSVVSGSMEPSIPVGSLVYIKAVAPEDVQEGDVAAFYGAVDSASIITHRVVENRTFMGELITKGDANQEEDINPVSYEQFIGRVEHSFPRLGALAELFTSHVGKIAAGGLIGAAVLLHLLANVLEWEPGRKAAEARDDRR